MWWVSAGKKHCSWWCAICGEKMNGERPTGHWWHKQVPSASQANVFNARAVPQGLCENLINALKLLAKQQKDGDSPIQSIVASFCERNTQRNYGGRDKHHLS